MSRIISLASVILTMLLGILVVYGWLTHDDFLRSIVPGAVKMKFNVALNFILCSIVVLISHFRKHQEGVHPISIFLCAIIFLTGQLTLSEYIFGMNLGIDELFINDELRTTSMYYAGRMSPISAFNFVQLGIGLLFLNKERTATFQYIYLFEMAFVALLMLVSLNFATDIPTFFRLAIHVAAGFIALPTAIFFAQPVLLKKINFEYLMLTGFIAAMLLTLVISLFSFYYNDERIKSLTLIDQSNMVLNESEKILSLAVDVESGGRGYIITKDSLYLERFLAAKEIIFGHVKAIQQLTSDIEHEGVSDSLFQVVHKRVEFSTKLIETRNEKGFEAANQMLIIFQGQQHTSAVRRIIQKIQGRENFLLTQRRVKNSVSNEAFDYAFSVLLVSLAILLAAIFFMIRYNWVKFKKAEIQIQKQNKETQAFLNSMSTLCAKVSPEGKILMVNRTALLGARLRKGELKSTNFLDGRWWAFSSEVHTRVRDFFNTACLGNQVNYDEKIFMFGQVLTINFSLIPIFASDKSVEYIIAEGRDITPLKVTETALLKQTHNLEAANKELEAFSYSVSHDLRTPLRAIHGYTKILSEDYKSCFDDEGRKMMSAVLENSKKMGQLIDDLLAFSKLGRAEIQLSRVDMTEIANSVFEDLKRSIPSLKAKVVVHPLPLAETDKSLIKQVFLNLISNAIKYSEKKLAPEIEINSVENEDEVIYYVKDNGVGFDMKYSNKLFGVFHRLHKNSEFEGNGVGLALVKRIISRQGGRVWAEAELDVGATFYFSLSKKQLVNHKTSHYD